MNKYSKEEIEYMQSNKLFYDIRKLYSKGDENWWKVLTSLNRELIEKYSDFLDKYNNSPKGYFEDLDMFVFNGESSLHE